MDDAIFFFFLGVALGGIPGIAVVAMRWDESWRRLCVDKGVAEWRIDPQTGERSFHFKQPKP